MANSVPRRELDAAALKALAHPLRVEIFDELWKRGPATASMLGEWLGQSSGATSYHLRQLQRHGLVREVEGKGTKRERYWERVPGGVAIGAGTGFEPAAVEAGRMIARQWADQRHREIDEYMRHADRVLPDEWTDNALLTAAKLSLTAAELGEVTEQIEALLSTIKDRFGDREAPADSRTVLLTANVFTPIEPEELNR